MRDVLLKLEVAVLLFGQLLMLAGCDDAPAPATNTPVPSGLSSVAAVEEPRFDATQLAIIASSTGQADVAAFEAALRQEPRVIDYVYDPDAAFQWTIGVKDDGSPRFGYAEYFCLRMKQEGLPIANTMVRIVDYAKYMEPGGNGRDASLGSVRCSDGEQIIP